jgi:hypothetical protein
MEPGKTNENILIGKAKAIINSLKFIEQIEACREFVELAKPYIKPFNYLELCNDLARRVLELEKEFNEYRLRLRTMYVPPIQIPTTEGCGTPAIEDFTDEAVTAENVAKVASTLILK